MDYFAWEKHKVASQSRMFNDFLIPKQFQHQKQTSSVSSFSSSCKKLEDKGSKTKTFNVFNWTRTRKSFEDSMERRPRISWINIKWWKCLSRSSFRPLETRQILVQSLFISRRVQLFVCSSSYLINLDLVQCRTQHHHLFGKAVALGLTSTLAYLPEESLRGRSKRVGKHLCVSTISNEWHYQVGKRKGRKRFKLKAQTEERKSKRKKCFNLQDLQGVQMSRSRVLLRSFCSLKGPFLWSNKVWRQTTKRMKVWWFNSKCKLESSLFHSPFSVNG